MNTRSYKGNTDPANPDALPDTNPRRARTAGLVIVSITFGLFGLWSLIAPLQSAALAPATVMVKGARKSIEHLEGGIIGDMLVRDGDSVRAGDLLIRLDDIQARAQLEISQGQYFSVKATEARLLAERDGVDAVAYPAFMLGSEDPRAAEAMQSQNQVFTARRNAHEGEIEVLRQRISQLGEQIKGTRTLIQNKKELAASYAEEIQDFSELLQDGFADKQHLRQIKRSKARIEGEVAEHNSEIAQLEIQSGETRLEILQLQKEFHTSVVDALGKTRTDIYDLEERLRAARDRVERTEIRSPVSGVVVGKTVTTKGEVVSPGEPLMYVVPQAEELIVEAQVSPIDIDRVHSGQTADIRFSAFKSTTPVIDGIVVSVSADALTDEQQGHSYYLARVELTPEGRKMLADLVLVPGMPAEVLINTGSRTLFQYLTQPIRNAFARSLIED